MRSKRLFLLLLLIQPCLWARTLGQNPARSISPRLISRKWEAQWITSPVSGLKAYEVYHFRRSFRLAEAQAAFVVHVSADSRYKLFVNGKMVGLGPARSDLAHWNFDSYDLAPYLQRGDNLVAALVWNQGEWNGLAQFSYRTAFIMQGDSAAEAIVNTDERWKVTKDEAYSPVVFKPSDPRLFWQYYVAGALDSVQASAYPWGWEMPGFNDEYWNAAKTLGNGTPAGPENGTMWTLVPRPVAYLEHTSHRFAEVRRSDSLALPAGFPGSSDPLTIPANSHAVLLLDARCETTGYPRFRFSGGQHAMVRIGYAETLLDVEKENTYRWHKTDRDVTEGKKFVGVYDVFVADGGRDRLFIPLWMRVFRYVQIEVRTGDQPLLIDDVSYDLSLYPFTNEAEFTSNDSLHQQIFDACLRTIRLTSQETYIDPYYEQMQYVGDTRIEALYAYYHFRDDRLTRNAIRQFAWSIGPEGLTMSRYPSSLPQYTPLYALCWMLMIKDHWMLRDDDAFVRQFMPAMLNVLQWFGQQVNAEGMLGDLPGLDFLDTFYPRDKILRGSKSRSLTPYSLFYVYTVQELASFFRHFGKAREMVQQEKIAGRVKQTVIRLCFDTAKGLFADNPEKRFFSQHANIMAVLTGCLSIGQEKAVLHKVLADTALLPVSLYFKFYEFEALKRAGMGAAILDEMGDWKTMLDHHLRTFSEWITDPRSECHAWSAYPAYFFLNTIAGIGPAEPGFTAVRIEPHPGRLTKISAQVPHPDGPINTDYEKGRDGFWSIRIWLPASINGTLIWKGKTHPLHGRGLNKFSLK
jgi:alpha-L-rhamnosidase